jgi:hypothetical protein
MPGIAFGAKRKTASRDAGATQERDSNAGSLSCGPVLPVSFLASTTGPCPHRRTANRMAISEQHHRVHQPPFVSKNGPRLLFCTHPERTEDD